MFSATLIVGTHALRSGSSGRHRMLRRPRLVARRQVTHAVDADLAARQLALPADHFEQLVLPVARDARDPDDLARPDLERDAVEHADAAVVDRADVVERQPHARPPSCSVRADDARGTSPPTIIDAISAVVSSFTGPCPETRPRRRTVTSSAKRRHLAKLVGDHQDADLPRARHPAEHAQHLVGLRRREHARRLVEDQDAVAEVELLQDLELLPLAGGERPDDARRIDLERHPLHERRAAPRAPCAQSMTIGRFARASTRFSATVMFGTSVKCW